MAEEHTVMHEKKVCGSCNRPLIGKDKSCPTVVFGRDSEGLAIFDAQEKEIKKLREGMDGLERTIRHWAVSMGGNTPLAVLAQHLRELLNVDSTSRPPSSQDPYHDIYELGFAAAIKKLIWVVQNSGDDFLSPTDRENLIKGLKDGTLLMEADPE